MVILNTFWGEGEEFSVGNTMGRSKTISVLSMIYFTKNILDVTMLQQLGKLYSGPVRHQWLNTKSYGSDFKRYLEATPKRNTAIDDFNRVGQTLPDGRDFRKNTPGFHVLFKGYGSV